MHGVGKASLVKVYFERRTSSGGGPEYVASGLFYGTWQQVSVAQQGIVYQWVNQLTSQVNATIIPCRPHYERNAGVSSLVCSLCSRRWQDKQAILAILMRAYFDECLALRSSAEELFRLDGPLHGHLDMAWATPWVWKTMTTDNCQVVPECSVGNMQYLKVVIGYKLLRLSS